MRGADYEQSAMFSYISAERRVTKVVDVTRLR
jgi:hypothetical protein